MVADMPRANIPEDTCIARCGACGGEEFALLLKPTGEIYAMVCWKCSGGSLVTGEIHAPYRWNEGKGPTIQ